MTMGDQWTRLLILFGECIVFNYYSEHIRLFNYFMKILTPTSTEEFIHMNEKSLQLE